MAQFVLTCKMNACNTQDGAIQTRSLVNEPCRPYVHVNMDIFVYIYTLISTQNHFSKRECACLLKKQKQKTKTTIQVPETCWLNSAKVDSWISNRQMNSDKVVGWGNNRSSDKHLFDWCVAQYKAMPVQFSGGQRNALLLLCGGGCGSVGFGWIAIVISVCKQWNFGEEVHCMQWQVYMFSNYPEMFSKQTCISSVSAIRRWNTAP